MTDRTRKRARTIGGAVLLAVLVPLLYFIFGAGAASADVKDLKDWKAAHTSEHQGLGKKLDDMSILLHEIKGKLDEQDRRAK